MGTKVQDFRINKTEKSQRKDWVLVTLGLGVFLVLSGSV